MVRSAPGRRAAACAVPRGLTSSVPSPDGSPGRRQRRVWIVPVARRPAAPSKPRLPQLLGTWEELGWYGCFYCDTGLEDAMEVDHVVPSSRGGLDAWPNLVPACPSCNGLKSDQLVSVFTSGALPVSAGA
ncbi:HNH endonuclease [Kitasatospora sp. NPDC059646]|uniref:HNH endonuclease n=1 Tax=Kitasatospora sp. NPDC059646 TaxID=3346893 RepID=UPI00368DD555